VREHYKWYNRSAIVAAIAIMLALAASFVTALTHAGNASGEVLQPTLTQVRALPTPIPLATPIPIEEPNVYVRLALNKRGVPTVQAYQYAGGDIMWDDCDTCADKIQLAVWKGDILVAGKKAHGKKGAVYRLLLDGVSQIFQRGSYRYRNLRTNRITVTNNHWDGFAKILERRGSMYVSEIFFAYYDEDVEQAPEGLTDPTNPTAHVK
jgi:hypothetical protein